MLLAHGFLKQIFEVFERYQTAIDMITTSEIAVSLTIDDPTHVVDITKELEKLGLVEVDSNQCIICLVGKNIMFEKSITNRVMKALDGIPLRMVSFGGSKNNVSLLIPEEDKVEALNKINKHIFSLREIEE